MRLVHFNVEDTDQFVYVQLSLIQHNQDTSLTRSHTLTSSTTASITGDPEPDDASTINDSTTNSMNDFLEDDISWDNVDCIHLVATDGKHNVWSGDVRMPDIGRHDMPSSIVSLSQSSHPTGLINSSQTTETFDQQSEPDSKKKTTNTSDGQYLAQLWTALVDCGIQKQSRNASKNATYDVVWSFTNASDIDTKSLKITISRQSSSTEGVYFTMGESILTKSKSNDALNVWIHSVVINDAQHCAITKRVDRHRRRIETLLTQVTDPKNASLETLQDDREHLLQQFVLLLNTKKEEIRRLREANNTLKLNASQLEKALQDLNHDNQSSVSASIGSTLSLPGRPRKSVKQTYPNVSQSSLQNASMATVGHGHSLESVSTPRQHEQISMNNVTQEYLGNGSSDDENDEASTVVSEDDFADMNDVDPVVQVRTTDTSTMADKSTKQFSTIPRSNIQQPNSNNLDMNWNSLDTVSNTLGMNANLESDTSRAQSIGSKYSTTNKKNQHNEAQMFISSDVSVNSDNMFDSDTPLKIHRRTRKLTRKRSPPSTSNDVQPRTRRKRISYDTTDTSKNTQNNRAKSRLQRSNNLDTLGGVSPPLTRRRSKEKTATQNDNSIMEELE